jgi:hypothetical protein
MHSAEMDLEERNLSNKFARYMKKYRVSSLQKKSSRCRIWRQRKSWEEFSALTDCQFCRYFRMTRECFDLLCTRIQDNVGEGTFKSEAYLREQGDDTLAPPDSVSMCQLRRLAKATFIQYCGLISGEVKLTITLRMLAGGSYLDLSLIFGTGTSYPYEIFCKVICHWICQD